MSVNFVILPCVLDLVLELFKQCPKIWFWIWNCLSNIQRFGFGIVYAVFEELVLIMELVPKPKIIG